MYYTKARLLKKGKEKLSNVLMPNTSFYDNHYPNFNSRFENTKN